MSGTGDSLEMSSQMALEILELAKFASRSEIDQAFRRLAKLRHPDHGGSHLEMVELRKAREVLICGQPPTRRTGASNENQEHAGDQAERTPPLIGFLWMVAPLGIAPILIVLVAALLL